MAKVSVGSPNTCVTPSSPRTRRLLIVFPLPDLRMGVVVIDYYLSS